MLRCVLLFAVSSHSVVSSVTVKAGSNTPKPNDPVVVRGWRADGFVGMARTPEKAEKALGVKVAPNDDLSNTNDYQKYYRTFEIAERSFTMRIIFNKTAVL